MPKYAPKSFEKLARANPPAIDKAAPAFGRKAVLYATCFTNYNDPAIGVAARAVLAKNGVTTEVVHPHCCGMPMLEQGRIDEVAKGAKIVAAAMAPWIEQGFAVIALVPSCALMLKFEWPLILPGDADTTYDLSEYVVDIAKTEGLAPDLKPIGAGVSLHIACHSRAQNMGPKAAEMLNLLPEADIQVIERCSVYAGADRRLPRARRPGHLGPVPPRLRPHGRAAGGRARRIGRRFFVTVCHPPALSTAGLI